MDWIAESIVTLSQVSRPNLALISLALTGVTIAYTGRSLSIFISRWLGRLHGVFRVPVKATLNLALFGALLVFAPPWLATLLGYFNNYTLAPILAAIFLAVGLLADRYSR